MKTINDIHTFIGSISGTIKLSLFQNRRLFNKLKPYLVPGTYRNSLQCNYIFETSKERHFDNVTFASNQKMHRLAKSIIKLITYLIIYKNNNESEFGGTEIIISSSHQEFKIFNIDKAEVLTLYSDREKFKRIVENKRIFESKFHVTETLKNDFENALLTERYVQQQKIDKEDAFLNIATQYAAYVSSAHVFFDRDLKDSCDYFAQRFGESDILCKITKSPMVFSHGDLWHSNIMYDGYQYYITDFEAAKPRYILYDLIYYIVSEYIINDDTTMIEYYFHGKYDQYIEGVLQAANIPFKTDNRDLYVLAYMVTIVNERWKNYTLLDSKIAKIINKYIPRYYR